MSAPAEHNYLTAAIIRLNREVEADLAVVPERPSPDQLLTTQYLADLLMVSPRTLENWRKDGRGPFVTTIEGMPRYRYADVVAWVIDQNPAAVSRANLREDLEAIKADWFEGRPDALAEYEKVRRDKRNSSD